MLMYIRGGMEQENYTLGSVADSSRRQGRSQDVWEAALTLFAERGYRGTTVRDIARELGIRGPSLYNHMRSKQEILRDIMFSTTERAFAAQRAAVAKLELKKEREESLVTEKVKSE
jgi:AcrR family transcriptional regulator